MMSKKRTNHSHIDNSGVENGAVKSANIQNCTGENSTVYGEFVSTAFNWVPPDEQRKRAEKLGKKL